MRLFKLVSKNLSLQYQTKAESLAEQMDLDALFRAARKPTDRHVPKDTVRRRLEMAYRAYLLSSSRANPRLDSSIVARRGSTQLIPKGNNKTKLSTIATKAEKAIKHGQTAIDGKPTAKLRKTVDNAFDQLLKKLTFPHPDTRDDKRDQELMRVLSWSIDGDSDKLEEFLDRIAAYKANLADAVGAAQELIPMLKTSTADLISIRKQTISPRDTGNTHINDLIASLLSIYREFTGREIATSVGEQGSDNEGIATGPVIRYLKLLLAPLDLYTDEHGLSAHENALRARVREVMETKSRATG